MGSERGVALIVALMVMTLMVALGTALILTTTTELKIARNFAITSEATYAADAVLERGVDDMLLVNDWSSLLNGTAASGFVDGMPTGTRVLADGTMLDLAGAINIANCEKTSVCGDEEMNRVTEQRPWGLNNARWKPFAWGPMSRLTPSSASSPFYVVLLVGDDPSECDNDPLVDGGEPVPPCGAGSSFNPGTGVLSLRAEAFGPFGTHKIIEATIGSAKHPNRGVRMLSWREVR